MTSGSLLDILASSAHTLALSAVEIDSDHPQLPPDTALLFSGGRDSSLALVRLALAGRSVQPIRFQTGTGVPSDLPSVRETELRRAFPALVRPSIVLPAYGLIRRVAIERIEDDFREFDGKNLILLGEMMALTTVAIRHCQAAGVKNLAVGTTAYQSDMPEQRAVAIEFFTQFCAQSGVAYLTPVADCESADDVKYQLWDLGVSTKSLEGISIFSDSFSRASDDTILRYLHAKESICQEFLDRYHLDGQGEAGGG